MNKDNPACYECPNGKSKLHTWSRIIEEATGEMAGAVCLYCFKVLNKEQAEDVWSET